MSVDHSSLDANKILERNLDESTTLEYKDKRADKRSLVRELTTLANTDGGRVLYGVRQDNGLIEKIQNISNPSKLEEDISQVLKTRTDPTVSVDMRKIDYEESTIMELSVEHQGVLHTYRPENNKPYVPIRVGTTTDFMTGSAIREFYRSNIVDRSMGSSISELRDEIRKKVHRVLHTFEKSDFEEVEDRVSFTLTVKDVAEELEDRLAEPHKNLEEDTKERMEEVIQAGQNLLDCQTRVNRSGVYSLGDRSAERGYTGDSPEEVERKYRDVAIETKESATSLVQHLM